MKRQGRLSFTWQTQMLLCFACGILTGTGAAIFLGGEIFERLEELGAAARNFGGVSGGEEGNLRLCWWYLLRRRMTAFFVGGLIFSTPFGIWGSMLLFFGLGFFGALAISVLTLESGWRGIFLFLRAVLPQWLIYGAVWVILAFVFSEGIGKLRFRAGIFLAAAVALGSFLEAFFRFYLT